jgi:hypothetical protein
MYRNRSLITATLQVVLESVGDSRFRDLVKGVKCAAAEPAVVSAFAVLYEDYLPVFLTFFFDSL